MHAPWRGTGISGALALLLCLAVSPAPAEDALLAPPLGGAAPPGSVPGESEPDFMAMAPAHGVPLSEPAPQTQTEPGDGVAPAPSEAKPVPPDAGGTPEESSQIPAPALPPVNAALKAALEVRSSSPGPTLTQRREREAIAAFYASRDFTPLWFSGVTANAAVTPAIERLKRAADDGLDVNGFPQIFSPTTDQEIASVDLALSDAVVAYGRQASGSRVDPRMISRLIGVEPEVADPAVILAGVASAGGDAGEELRRFNPPQRGYEALREKLLQLRGGHGVAGRDPAIPPGPVLRPGMRDPRVPLLRARLSLDDAAAVEDFDLRHEGRDGGRRFPESQWTAGLGQFDGAHRRGLLRRPFESRSRNPRQYGALAVDAARHGRDPYRSEYP